MTCIARILMAVAIALIASVLSTNTKHAAPNGFVALPRDVLNKVMPYTKGSDQLKSAERKLYDIYKQPMETLTPLLIKMVNEGLTDSEVYGLNTCYRKMLVNGKLDLLARVPGIIKDQILSIPAVNVSAKVNEINKYFTKFNSANRLVGLYISKSFEMLKFYIVDDAKLEWLLMPYQHYWGQLFSRAPNLNISLIYWNGVASEMRDRWARQNFSFQEACDMCIEGYNIMRSEWKSLSQRHRMHFFHFQYLREVWSGSFPRIPCVGQLHMSDMTQEIVSFVSSTHRIFRRRITDYIQHQQFDALKAFLVELKKRNRLFLLQRDSVDHNFEEPIIPTFARDYNFQEWEMIWQALSPLLETHLVGKTAETDRRTFVEQSFLWQNTKLRNVLLMFSPGMAFRKAMTAGIQLLKLYNLHSNQPCTSEYNLL